MSEPQDAGKYQVSNDGTMQGPVIGDHATVHQHFTTTPQPARVHDQNHQRFLVYLRTRYQDVLKKSLQGAALIALGLHTKPEAIAHPAHLVFRHLDQTEKPLPTGTSVTEVYGQAGGELLILGEPGAGKSTLLVHLAQGLLTRAEQDQEHLLPVIFNLSSWAQKRRPLSEWLVEELLISYQVPRKVGKLWVENGQILPLLDGLDEVAVSARDLCIDAINTYRRGHLVPLVVCSRTSEYFSQEHRLVLQNAVVVQPLTTEQVDDYLVATGPALTAVRSVLQKNQVLRELAASPLMLNVLTLAYRDSSAGALPTSGSIEEQQRQVFASYVQRMLPSNGTEWHTSSQHMLRWLIWLARLMQKHSQAVFYIEQLQPSWLSGHRMLQTYDWWAIRLPSIFAGILVSLAIALPSLLSFLSPFFLSPPSLSPPTWLILVSYLFLGGLLGEFLSRRNAIRQSLVSARKGWDTLWGYLFAGLLTGIFTGLLFGFLLGLEYGQDVGLLAGLASGTWNTLLHILLGKTYIRLEARNRLLIGLPVGLISGLVVGLASEQAIGLTSGIFVGLTLGIFLGLMSGFLNGLITRMGVAVQLTDRIIWSPNSPSSKRTRKITLLILGPILCGIASCPLLFIGPSFHAYSPPTNGATFKPISEPIIAELTSELTVRLIIALIGGLLLWYLFGLFQGVSSKTIEDQRRTVPNQGIRRSAINSLVSGLVCTTIVGALCTTTTGLIDARFNMLNNEWLIGLLEGLSIGLLTGLFNGGLAYLRHYTLRFLLWRERSIPWKFPEFLDEAARHILLHKVGGGYVFIHRLFLDYIASLDGQQEQA